MKANRKTIVNSGFLSLWWFPIFVGTVVLVGSLMVVVPKVNQIISDGSDLERVESDLRDAEKKVQQLKSVDKNQLVGLHTSFRQALPSQKPYYEVLLLLQQLGAQTGVSVGDFELNPGSLASDSAKTDTSSTKNGVVYLDTKLNVSGSIEQVSGFISRLYRSVPLLEIANISISGSSGNSTEVNVRRVSFELKIVYLPDKPIAKTVSIKPLNPLSGAVDEVLVMLAEYYNPMADVGSYEQPLSDYSRTDIFNF